MTRRKRKLTPAQKAHKKFMREKYEWVFLNGKQKRIRRAPTIDGMPVEEFIRRNADPIWLVQNEMQEELNKGEQPQEPRGTSDHDKPKAELGLLMQSCRSEEVVAEAGAHNASQRILAPLETLKANVHFARDYV